MASAFGLVLLDEYFILKIILYEQMINRMRRCGYLPMLSLRVLGIFLLEIYLSKNKTSVWLEY